MAAATCHKGQRKPNFQEVGEGHFDAQGPGLFGDDKVGDGAQQAA